MVRFSEIQQFPDFLELFPGYFRTICPRFENFGIFGRMVSALSLNFSSCRSFSVITSVFSSISVNYHFEISKQRLSFAQTLALDLTAS